MIELRQKHNLKQNGIAASNIRRQLKRLRDIFIVEKIRNKYRITEFNSLKNIFEEKIEQYMLNSVITRVKEYMDEVDKSF